MSVYIKAAQIVEHHEVKHNSKFNFTCLAVDTARFPDGGSHSNERDWYENLFEFSDNWAAGPTKNEKTLWNMKPKDRYNLRLLLLCMADAVMG